MFDFQIRPDDGEPFQVTAGSRDMVVWERTGRDKTLAGLMENMAMTDLYRIAHIAARRQGLYDGTLQDFEQTVELDFEETPESDPTSGGRSTGPSSPSPSPPGSRQASGRKRTTAASSPRSS